MRQLTLSYCGLNSNVLTLYSNFCNRASAVCVVSFNCFICWRRYAPFAISSTTEVNVYNSVFLLMGIILLQYKTHTYSWPLNEIINTGNWKPIIILEEPYYKVMRASVIHRKMASFRLLKLLLLPPANEVWDKIMSLRLSMILFTGGMGLPHRDLPPPRQRSLGQKPTGQRAPYCKERSVRILLECILV